MSCATRTPLFKPLAMMSQLSTTITMSSSTPTSLPFFSLPSKPLLHLSLKNNKFFSSSSSSSPLVPLVASTSDWAQQEEEEESPLAVVEEESGEEDEYVDPPEEAKLFVGNLPYDVTSETLANLFLEAGIVEVCEVIYNRETEQSRGFGFVWFRTVEEAEKAVAMFHQYNLNGRSLTVNKAAPKGSRPERTPRTFEPSFRIYIGNLPWQTDDARLEQVFSEYGKVVQARVVYDRETGRSRGFGFVTMSAQSELDDAIEALDGQSLDGRTVKVNVAEERPRGGSF